MFTIQYTFPSLRSDDRLQLNNPILGATHLAVYDHTRRPAPSASSQSTDYELWIGDSLISGRDEHYVPAVRSQVD
jgi:hypothetical protein